jgi:hypothetical protein
LKLPGDFADVVFTVAQTQVKAAAFRTDIRRRAVAAGRGPDAVKVSLGVVVLVAATEAEARARAERLFATLPIERLTAQLLTNLGLPEGALGPDDPMASADLPEAPPAAAFSAGFSTSTRALIAECPRTPRELIIGAAGGSGHRLVVGSAKQIADDLEAWYRAGTADGFTIMPAETAVDLEQFAHPRGADLAGAGPVPPGLPRADAARTPRVAPERALGRNEALPNSHLCRIQIVEVSNAAVSGSVDRVVAQLNSMILLVAEEPAVAADLCVGVPRHRTGLPIPNRLGVHGREGQVVDRGCIPASRPLKSSARLR